MESNGKNKQQYPGNISIEVEEKGENKGDHPHKL